MIMQRLGGREDSALFLCVSRQLLEERFHLHKRRRQALHV
jgi:hypothetical protein